MILRFSDVLELKRIIAEKFSLYLHFHDGCGGQYFTVDEPTEELKAFLIEYFAEQKVKVHFSNDGTQFSLTKAS